MFEKASRLKLRFGSSVGRLSVEDLWDLSLQDLNIVAKGLNSQLKSAEEEDFLKEESTEDIKTKLGFDIVLYILKTKKEEKKNRKEAKERKAMREKILEIKEKKQDKSLENLSEEELDKKLKELE